MYVRYTQVRIVKDSEVIASFDARNEPSIYKDLLTAISNDMSYGGYGDNDVIVKAHCYMYDNVRHWIFELVTEE